MGVIGLGAMGQNHVRVLSEMEGVELAAVFDEDAERCREVAEKVGARAASTLDAFVSLVDGASVATPTTTHRALGEALFAAGKHAMIEKPIAATLEDARALVEAAKANGCVLQVGHIERFNPVMGGLEAMVQAPRFIEIERLSPFPKRSTDVDVILDVMIHDLEIVLHLVESELKSIDAVGVPVITGRSDIANVRLRFADGCVANVAASRISEKRSRTIRIFQGDAYVSADFVEQAGKVVRRVGAEVVPGLLEVTPGEPLARELADFVRCARAGERAKVSGEDAARALEVALWIGELLEEGGGMKEVGMRDEG